MNESSKSAVQAWQDSQQAFFKALPFMSPTTSDTAPTTAQSPLQEQFADLQSAWKESIEKWTEFTKDGPTPKSFSPEALQQMFTPARWSGSGGGVFDSALQRVLEGPKYATLWDLDRKLLDLQRLVRARDKNIAAFQAIVQRAWNTAFQRFSASFANEKAEKPKTWRELTDRWLSVANETLIESHRTNEFVEAQTRMLRSASEHRLQERRLAEAWCEASHIPTRTEVDELQRTVTELRRQVRQQARQRVSAPSGPKAATPVRKPNTTGSTSRRRSKT